MSVPFFIDQVSHVIPVSLLCHSYVGVRVSVESIGGGLYNKSLYMTASEAIDPMPSHSPAQG